MEAGRPVWTLPWYSHEDPGTMPRFLAWPSCSEKEQVRAILPDKKFKMRRIHLKMDLETKDGVMGSGSSPLSNHGTKQYQESLVSHTTHLVLLRVWWI